MRDANDPLVVTALGMVSPVGVNATQTFTSVRAEICRKRERPDLHICLAEEAEFETGEPLVASAITHLDTRYRDENRPTEWLAYMAAEAFFELRQEAHLPRGDEGAAGLFLSLPAPHGAWGTDMLDRFGYHFHNWAEEDPFPHEQYERIGHSGALKLCEDACRLLDAGTIRYAVVGGVDSYLFPPRLSALDREYRIWSERNHDGFCPGEAAAFFLVEAASQARARGLRPWLALKQAAGATCNLAPNQPNTGAVLADVLGKVIPPAPPSPLLVCDLNGETDRMKEWGFALSRLGPKLKTPFALEHPARCLGDIGAASGAALVVLAARYLQTKHQELGSALVWAASDGGDRRAVLFDRPQPPSGTVLHA
jgi:3-oxoacyl-[acyl-carrier-protein] synthase I